MRFEADVCRTDLFGLDRGGKPVAVRNGEIRLRTDDGAEAYLAVCAADTAQTVSDGVHALIGQMTAGPMPRAASRSIRYRPSPEQAVHSPLLAACAARGMTEAEVIEALFREAQRLHRELAEALVAQLPAQIKLGRDTFEPKERP